MLSIKKEQEATSLDDCINIALKNHPRIIKAKADLVQSQEKLNKANSGFLPRIDAVLSYDRLSYVQQQKKRYLRNSNNDYQAGIYLNQPLFSGGSILSERTIAALGIDLARIEETAEKLSVANNTRKAYFMLLHAMSVHESSRGLLRYAEDFYNEAAGKERYRWFSIIKNCKTMNCPPEGCWKCSAVKTSTLRRA